jgi:hypothetical protein
MTEGEWLACTDPVPMLEALRGRASERKLRLFACGCFRRVWRLLADSRDRRVIRLAELNADTVIGGTKLARACQVAGWRWFGANHPAYRNVTWLASAPEVAADASRAARALAGDEAEPAAQTALLRCLFGNPHGPTAAIAADCLLWSGCLVYRLAEGIYHDHAFDRMPVLGDCLEDAGCTDPAVLAHCRAPVHHARGCHVVDRILGKG